MTINKKKLSLIYYLTVALFLTICPKYDDKPITSTSITNTNPKNTTTDNLIIILNTPNSLQNDTKKKKKEFKTCNENDDYKYKLCILTQQKSIYTSPYITNCPSNFTYNTITPQNSDSTTIYIPKHLSLCFPYNENKDYTTMSKTLSTYTKTQCISNSDTKSFYNNKYTTDYNYLEDYKYKKITLNDKSVQQYIPKSNTYKYSVLTETINTTTTYKHSNAHNVYEKTMRCLDNEFTKYDTTKPTTEIYDNINNDCNGITNDLQNKKATYKHNNK